MATNPLTLPQGPFSTVKNIAPELQNRGVISTNPTDYSTPQSAITAGIDPTAVTQAWAKQLAGYPTQAAAVAAGIAPTVVTQLWGASRAYVQPPAPPNNAWLIPALAALGAIALLAYAHGGKS